MKYVLYDGKAYEVSAHSHLTAQDKQLSLIGGLLAWPVDCTEITEAEYHARKLLECSGHFTYSENANGEAVLKDFVKQCEQERTPKPEVTEAHIGCLVEVAKIKGDWSDSELYQLSDTAWQYDGYRLPRQPVPLAFHKHDGGERPEWVGQSDHIVYFAKGVGFSAVAQYKAEWSQITYFAVIKPVLPND